MRPSWVHRTACRTPMSSPTCWPGPRRRCRRERSACRPASSTRPGCMRSPTRLPRWLPSQPAMADSMRRTSATRPRRWRRRSTRRSRPRGPPSGWRAPRSGSRCRTSRPRRGPHGALDRRSSSGWSGLAAPVSTSPRTSTRTRRPTPSSRPTSRPTCSPWSWTSSSPRSATRSSGGGSRRPSGPASRAGRTRPRIRAGRGPSSRSRRHGRTGTGARWRPSPPT